MAPEKVPAARRAMGKTATLFRCFSLAGRLFYLAATNSGIDSWLPARRDAMLRDAARQQIVLPLKSEESQPSGEAAPFRVLKVHSLMTESGIPVEIFLSPWSYSDTNSLYDFSFPVPSGSVVYGDKAYNAYNIEDELEQSGIHLNPVRKKNSKRKYESVIGDGVSFIRKRIESAFSVIK